MKRDPVSMLLAASIAFCSADRKISEARKQIHPCTERQDYDRETGAPGVAACYNNPDDAEPCDACLARAAAIGEMSPARKQRTLAKRRMIYWHRKMEAAQ